MSSVFLMFGYLLLITLWLPQSVWAGGDRCETIQSGVWENPGIWTGCSGGIPINDSFVTIKTDHVVTLNGDSPLMNQFGMEAGSELIIAPEVGGITMTSEFSDFNSSSGRITLQGDLTLIGDNASIILGRVDGAAALSIYSPLETRFTDSIGASMALTFISTDAAGSTVINIQSQDPSINSTGVQTYADSVVLQSAVDLNANAVELQAADIAEFDLSLNTTDSSGLTSISGDVSGTGNLIKTGSGSITFFAATSLTGDVRLNGGFVIDNSASGNPFPAAVSITLSDVTSMGDGMRGDFILSNGQTIAGNGVCLCRLIASSGSIVSPGLNSGGLLDAGNLFAADIVMATGAVLVVELNGTAAGFSYDQLSVENAVLDGDMAGGGTLYVSLNFNPEIGEQFTLINSFKDAIISDTFFGLAEGELFLVGSYYFSISYVGGSGNEVVLTVVNQLDLIFEDSFE